jgi:uncharacterized membrane protein YidH (DUF202 family)
VKWRWQFADGLGSHRAVDDQFRLNLYKTLHGFAQSGTVLSGAAQPGVVGLFLIGLGTISVLMGAAEYWQRAKELSAYQSVPIWQSRFIMDALIVALSVFLFGAVAFKLLWP